MNLSLIVAMDNNRLIGCNNQLPWHLPADLAYFKSQTIGKSILMGRKTYDSIGQALPNRHNIVLSSNKSLKIDGVSVVHDITQAKKLVAEKNHQNELMVIGGSSLYEVVLNQVQRMYITYVDGEFEGDTWFPKIDDKQWLEVTSQSHEKDDKNDYKYRFVILQRKKINKIIENNEPS